MDLAITPLAVFRDRRIVAPGDVDELGHVNNVVWVRYVFELAQGHSDAVGLTMDAYRRLGGFWIVRRHEIDYRREALAGEEIVGTTWVDGNRGPLNTRRYRFQNAADGGVLVRAATTWAFVETASGRACRPPREAVEAFPVTDAPPIDFQ
jgi:acyl-CoA thioester hydrolase